MRQCSWGRIQGWLLGLVGCALLLYLVSPSPTQPGAGAGKGKRDVGKTSYDQIAPVILGQTTFAEMKSKDIAGKPAVTARQQALLKERYDLVRRVDPKVKM